MGLSGLVSLLWIDKVAEILIVVTVLTAPVFPGGQQDPDVSDGCPALSHV